jgi:hypothetical protein
VCLRCTLIMQAAQGGAARVVELLVTRALLCVYLCMCMCMLQTAGCTVQGDAVRMVELLRPEQLLSGLSRKLLVHSWWESCLMCVALFNRAACNSSQRHGTQHTH